MFKEKIEANYSKIITLPEDFEQMTVEQINDYYFVPNQQPDDAYIFEESAFLSFRLGKENVGETALEDYKTNAFDAVFSKGTKDYQSELNETLRQIHYSFETISQQPQYIKAIAALHKNKILNVVFACFTEDKDHWEPIISNSFKTLKN